MINAIIICYYNNDAIIVIILFLTLGYHTHVHASTI